MKGGCFDDLDNDALAKWKAIRVVAMDEKIFTMPSYLVYFPHLVVITCQKCTREMATTIFDYAASSSTLRTLEVTASETSTDDECSITLTMAEKLHQWIKSQPVESIAIKSLVWELYSQRHTVVSSALAKLSLKELEIVEDYGFEWYFSGNYCRAEKVLQFEFVDPRNGGFENLDMLIESIHSFGPVLDTDIKDLVLFEFCSEGFNDLWPLFVPLIQRLQLEELCKWLKHFKMPRLLKWCTD
ncbi:hypothetical protein AC1031_011370 [Aphanomyces cochlioides]|nr:hypothetical protein AC1031_011370 [Aphanomyces cochlioides]